MKLGIMFTLLCLVACSSVRSGYRTMRNEEREGTKAPELDLSDAVWVNGTAADVRGDAEWTAYVFFKPN